MSQLVKVGEVSVEVPTNLSVKAQAAKDAIEHHRSYVGTIDCEENKIFVSQELSLVMAQAKTAKQAEEKITKPLVAMRADILTVKRDVENLFLAERTYLATSEKLLKGELLRYDNVVTERKRLNESEARRQAEEEAQAERNRLMEIARLDQLEAESRAETERIEAARLEAAGEIEDAKYLREQAAVAAERDAVKIANIKEEAASVEVTPVIVVDESIKVKGDSYTTRWVAEPESLLDVLAGIADGSTPIDALRVRVNNKVMPAADYVPRGFPAEAGRPLSEVEGIEINMPWFHEKARQLEKQFRFRGMKAVALRELRKRA